MPPARTGSCSSARRPPVRHGRHRRNTRRARLSAALPAATALALMGGASAVNEVGVREPPVTVDAVAQVTSPRVSTAVPRISRAGGRVGLPVLEAESAAKPKPAAKSSASSAKTEKRDRPESRRTSDARSTRSARARERHEAKRWVLPVTGYRLSARFGDAGSLWADGTHSGLDLAAPEGRPIRSIARGVVTIAGYSPRATWAGNLVVVRLEDGRTVWYAHQSSVAVAPGQRVNAGELIGYVGSTGNSSGAHLHLELQAQGEAVDPEKALVRRGLAL